MDSILFLLGLFIWRKNMLIKLKFHSIVDVITNSSTVIFTYQDSVAQAKELIAEILKMTGSSKTPDDIFYYGVFCELDSYLDDIEEEFEDDDEELPNGLPTHDDWKTENELREKWLLGIITRVIKGEIEKPEWMDSRETNCDEYRKSTELYLIPKSDEYNELGEKIQKLLGSVSGDGYRDG